MITSESNIFLPSTIALGSLYTSIIAPANVKRIVLTLLDAFVISFSPSALNFIGLPSLFHSTGIFIEANACIPAAILDTISPSWDEAVSTLVKLEGFVDPNKPLKPVAGIS